MRTYYFQDCDDDNEDVSCDISGEEYHQLLQLALQHCSYFSWDVLTRDMEKANNESLLANRYMHFADSTVPQKVWNRFRWFPAERRFSREYYVVDQDTISYLEQHFDSVFSFVHCWGFSNPENLTFYREDHTILFLSNTHEGDCYLFLKENEDGEKILAKGNWKPYALLSKKES